MCESKEIIQINIKYLLSTNYTIRTNGNHKRGAPVPGDILLARNERMGMDVLMMMKSMDH